MSPNNNKAAGAGTLTIRTVNGGYVRNPAAGDYTVDVATTDEPTFVTSSVFTVSGIFDLTGTSVTVTPTGTRQAAQWTLSATTSGVFNTNVRANIDSIQIIFPDGVTLPSEIDPSDITVNDVSVSSLDDIDISSGNTVTFLSPVSIGTTLYAGGDPEQPAAGSTGSFTIRFLASASIENPDVTGTYPVKIRTISGNNKIASNDKNFQFLKGDVMDSSFTTYTVTTNNDSTSTSTVSIAPALADTIAAYTIVFNSGSGGKLTQNEGTITITFPTGTTVPPGTISGILINDNTVTDASGDSAARTLTLITPVDIANSEVVTIEIPTGASIRNPSGGTYTLRVATSSLPNNTISDQYVINPTNVLAFSSISVSPNVVNTVAEYTISFLTGTTGALASADSIYLVFPRHTTLPANISVSSVTIASGGFADNPLEVVVQKGDTANADTVMMRLPFGISASANVTVTFLSSANIVNPYIPTTSGGNYQLRLRTEVEGAVVSNQYLISSSSTTKITAPVATLASTTAGAVTTYDLAFNLGSRGALLAGQSTITVTFPSGTNFQNFRRDSIRVNGKVVAAVDTSQSTSALKIAVITTDTTLVNSASVTLSMRNSIRNPPAGTYVIRAYTMPEPTEVNSSSYGVGTSVTLDRITFTDTTANGTSRDTVIFTNTSGIAINSFSASDLIYLYYPDNTEIPDGDIDSVYVFWDDANAGDGYHRPTITTGSNSARKLTIKIIGSGEDIDAGTTNIRILLPDTIGKVNPTIPAQNFYRMQINTSTDPVLVNSRFYEIVADNLSSVSNVTVNVNPTVINAASSRTVGFRVGSKGKLVGGAAAGTSAIIIDFDTGTNVPVTMSGSGVQVNGVTCDSVTIVSSGNGGVIRVPLPIGLEVENNDSVTVFFTQTSGITNGGTAASYNSTTVYTTSQSLAATAVNSYTLTATANLSVNQVTLGTLTVNAAASYSIKFSTGSSGALAANTDSIIIFFPYNTLLPASISPSNILVNATTVTATPSVNTTQRRLAIRVPVGIAALENVTVLINSTAGIRNPSIVGTYTLTVHTNIEPTPVTSPTYSTTAATSSVTRATVTPERLTTSSRSAYQISFSTGALGRLDTSSQSIIVTFNSSTTVSSTIADYDSTTITVGGTTTLVPTSYISANSGTRTVRIRPPVVVGNNTTVVLYLNDNGSNDPITNPGTESNYTLNMSTDVETSLIPSYDYYITNAGPVTGVVVGLTNDTVNAIDADSVRFTIGASSVLTGGSHTVTIIWPNNTNIPSSIATSNVLFRNVTTNSAYATAQAVTTIPGQRLVTVTLPASVSLGNSQTGIVYFAPGAQILNPSIYGDYTLQVRTTTQPALATSSTYTLERTTTTITGLNVSITPLGTNSRGQFTFFFNTGSRGRLLSGTSYIGLVFPDNTTVPGSIVASTIRVNNTTASTVVTRAGAGAIPDTVLVTVPNSATIGNSTAVTVIVDSTADILTASSTTALTYEAFTSVEDSTRSADFTLPVELLYFQLAQAEDRIDMEWQTASEIDNAYWIVERAEVGTDSTAIGKENTALSFASVTTLKGQGTKPSTTTYRLSDTGLEVGKIYAYRLADISLSGRINYHETQYVTFNPPKVFALYQNYPNPFNPTTTIKYQLAKDSKVSIRIYNILGQEVNRIVSGERPAGFHQIVWNGRNKQNNLVSSGVYIYRIEARSIDGTEKFVKNRKLMFLK